MEITLKKRELIVEGEWNVAFFSKDGLHKTFCIKGVHLETGRNYTIKEDEMNILEDGINAINNNNRWRAKENEEYFCIIYSEKPTVTSHFECFDTYDDKKFKEMNYFKTEKDAYEVLNVKIKKTRIE